MALYSYLRANPKATQFEIEENLDGNLCRCTGYRPILDAARLFGADSTAPESAVVRDAFYSRPAKRSELAFPEKLKVSHTVVLKFTLLNVYVHRISLICRSCSLAHALTGIAPQASLMCLPSSRYDSL